LAIDISSEELMLLRSMAQRFPSVPSAAAEIAALSATLALPRESIHVVSDVHGEYKKLRHIINNASGHLRPLVVSLFADQLSEAEIQDLLTTIYYPQEMTAHRIGLFQSPAERTSWVRQTLRRQFDIIRSIAAGHRREAVTRLFPDDSRELFEELLAEKGSGRGGFIDSMLISLSARGSDLTAIRGASRLIRNLSIDEIVVAGDLGDRGPRLDRVIDYLMQQPRVAIAWGNHDASWMGACIGSEVLIATVLRISLRYRRLSQLEEGYGLIISPLERLAREVYAEDPAERFRTKGSGLRDDLLMARMQKAISIIQFKLEGQLIDRHPEWQLESRKLLHRIDRQNGTVEIGGHTHPLLDRDFPTLSADRPYELSAEEQLCVNRLRESFVASDKLWAHMSYLVRNGSMWIRRDDALIFHGCVPVDESGERLGVTIDGKTVAGRALFDSLDSLVRRSFRDPGAAAARNGDWFWYLWSGARSPLFGKDRMTSFEGHFIQDHHAAKETKNAYFSLINDGSFCRSILSEFGVHEDGIIVNGHVPVKVDKGELPIKKGGNAVTIDGAFSEAYGDRGYTLILGPERITIAEHHHFESVDDAITKGADIIPTLTTVRDYPTPRTVSDTSDGAQIRSVIATLERLIVAYDQGVLLESDPRSSQGVTKSLH